jgi:NADH:ubiquinone oxidoreductase subunit K
MNLSVPIVIVSAVIGLVGIGIYCLLITRNLIRVVVGLQILTKGAMLALVFAGNIHGQPSLGQSMALTVIVADTIIAVIGLAFAVQVKRRMGTLDIKDLSILKR